MTCWRWILVAVLCGARLAAAQLTLADDFDGADGGWDVVSEPYVGHSVRPSPSAAISGARGMEFEDLHSDAGIGSGPGLGRYFDGVGDQFVRTWWRVAPQTGADQNISFIDLMADSAFGTAVEVKWNPSTSSVFNICFTAAGQFVSPLSYFPLDAGFHLIEASGRNMGSANGVCQFAIDGVLVETKPVDFSGERWELLTIGPVYGEAAWTGVMQFDSVIAGPTPAPSRLVLASTGPLAIGGCAFAKVVMTESFTSGPAPLPWPTPIELQVLGAQTFSDPACTVPSQRIIAPAGNPYVMFYLRPESFAVAVTAQSPDLMPVSFQPSVQPASDGGGEPTPDGGAPGDPSRRIGQVGCGCSLAAGPEWLVVALLALRRSARAPRQ